MKKGVAVAAIIVIISVAAVIYYSTLPSSPTPANFEVSNLVVSPLEVESGEEVTISATVTNVGEESGSYTVEVNLNDAVVYTETIPLNGGESTLVTFTVTRNIKATYSVEVADLSSTFTVFHTQIAVTSTADSGSGTLRQALLEAQNGDIITFNSTIFPPEAPTTIYLNSNLPPVIQGNLTIDSSNTGVIVDGSHLSEFVAVLDILSNGNTIQGLQFVNSPGAGIVLSGGAQSNIIGGDRNIGLGLLGQGNLVSNTNTGIGLWDNGTSFNTIMGNLIGTDVSGTSALGNGCNIGIYISEGASHNIIGPNNIIAYTQEQGIGIVGSNSVGNTITQNSIYNNKGRAIYLQDGNTELMHPLIFDFDLDTGTVTGGTYPNGIVELFSDDNNEGENFEGRMIADDAGTFTFNKGTSFIGNHLTATVTDVDGSTSVFSWPTSGRSRSTLIQVGNNLPKTKFQSKQSGELMDNRMGCMLPFEPGLPKEAIENRVLGFKKMGLKWVETGFDYFDWPEAEEAGRYSEYYIGPDEEKAVMDYNEDGIKLVCVLIFWDEAILDEMKEEGYSRFKTEREILRWLDYVRFIVHHFKGRIEYYQIWNEPNCPPYPGQHIELIDYINIVNRTIPVIHQEDPMAKIVVGGIPGMHEAFGRDYFFGIIKSDIMPLVDAITWHPFLGGASPGIPEEFHDDWGGPEYYYNYSSLVQEIKDIASTHGFKGEYISKEMQWLPTSSSGPIYVYRYSEIVAAKYTIRGIVMHLGMNVTTGFAGIQTEVLPVALRPIDLSSQNLCTVMAGTEPTSLSIEIQIEANNVRNYSYSLPNGDQLVALWTDGVAIDYDPGVMANLTIYGFTAQDVISIDVLNGFEQSLIVNNENGDLVIQNLIVRDYPLILHITKSS